MAKLTGIAIYKLLPKTNCGDCNVPTCMAFAMQVAAKKVALDACPHVSEEAKAELADAAAPPMRIVTIGTGPTAVQIGGETVLFRHEEKFHRATALAIRVKDTDDIAKAVGHINGLHFVRSGKEVYPNLVALEQTGDAAKFTAAVKTARENTQLPLVLLSSDPASIAAALEADAANRPLVCGADKENWKAVAELCAKAGVPLAVKGASIEELAELTTEIRKSGLEDLVLVPAAAEGGNDIAVLTMLRRLSLEKNFRPVGYPVMTFSGGDEPYMEVMQAILQVCKYSSLLVMTGSEPWQVLPVLTARYNIFTDPQVPNAVEAKLYKVGDAGADSPVMVTTNFALTYFTVEGEVEASKVPSYIAVVETGGLGVLNSYADDKLSGESIAKAVKATGVWDQVKHKKLIIPGLVAVLKGELEDESGCEVIVGPEEASGIPLFLKAQAR